MRWATWPRRRPASVPADRPTPPARSPRGVSSRTRSPTCPPAGATGRCRGCPPRRPPSQRPGVPEDIRPGAARFRPHVRGAEGVPRACRAGGRTTRPCSTTWRWPRVARGCGRGAARRTGRPGPRPDVPAGPRRPRPAPADAGRAADALASFAKATELEPSNPSYWTNLGNAARELGERRGRRPRTSARCRSMPRGPTRPTGSA